MKTALENSVMIDPRPDDDARADDQPLPSTGGARSSSTSRLATLALITQRRSEGTSETRVVLRSGGRTILLHPAEILWAKADRNYTRIATRSLQLRVRTSISTVAERLAPFGFLRVQRSVIVNLHEVVEVRRTGRSHQVLISDGTTLPLSGECREPLLAGLGLDESASF